MSANHRFNAWAPTTTYRLFGDLGPELFVPKEKMMNKQLGWSRFEIKSLDDDARTFEGIATTPITDRQDDIVEPKGAVFKLPIPMLWAHAKGEMKDPIGAVTSAKVTADGIFVKGYFAKLSEPPSLKDDLDRAWALVKAKLVRGLSIGFNPLEAEPIKGTFGMRFLRWEFLELSPVPIAANADASITSIKSIDQQQRAVSGHTPPRSIRLETHPVVSGKTLSETQGNRMKTYTEQIKDLENTRAAKAARRAEVMEKSVAEGRSTEEAEGEEFDSITAELAQIDKDLGRLRMLEAENVAQAKTVDGSNQKASGESRSFATVKTTEKLQPGVAMARFVMCLASAKGDLTAAARIGQAQYPNDGAVNTALKGAAEIGSSAKLITKAPVAAGTTVDATWAAPLLAYNTFAGDFIEFLRPMTIIGKFGQNGVPSLRRIPFNSHIRGQTTGGAGYWVGEGAPKPVTSFGFNDVYLGYTKVANIAVLTEEIIRFSDPSAEQYVRDALAGALIERMDIDFIDPTKAAVANVSPASITNGVTAIASSGDTADDIRADIAALWATAVGNNMPLSSAVYIADAATALRLGLMRNALGQAEFPNVNMNGGTLEGVPLIISNYVPHPTAGSLFILAFASEIWLADDGQVSVVASREASLQMDSAPTNNSATPTATTMVSMFQTDSVALRAERFVNWQKRRAGAVAYLSGVSWGS